jgi:hypothetical protein
MSTTPIVPLQPPGANPQNVQATKYYVFNETGNIMMATTDNSGKTIEGSVRTTFSEVAVFFAAMTKAITTTPNPATPGQNYSLYNYTALGSIIGGSGLFVHVTEEDVTYTSTNVGVALSAELVQALLGLATGAGELSFASAMIASMGNEALNINAESSKSDSSVANIVFVCEYLLGMPIVSAIVVYMNVAENILAIQAGPCFKTTASNYTWTMHKDTYLFVTPSSIRAYASDLDTVATDPDYTALISYLSDLLTQTPTIANVYQGSSVAPTALQSGVTYTLNGTFLGQTGTLKFVGASATGTITTTTWTPNAISFTVATVQSAAYPIGVYPTGATSPVVQTSQAYTITS